LDSDLAKRVAVKYWETIADKLSKAGWSLGWVSAIDSEGRTIWIVDAHRDTGKRFVVRSDEMLSAFLELERITHELALSALLVMTVIEVKHRNWVGASFNHRGLNPCSWHKLLELGCLLGHAFLLTGALLECGRGYRGANQLPVEFPARNGY
jgi:hypothetical protein